MKLNWNFQRGGGGVLEKFPSVGEEWILSGTIQSHFISISREINSIVDS